MWLLALSGIMERMENTGNAEWENYTQWEVAATVYKILCETTHTHITNPTKLNSGLWCTRVGNQIEGVFIVRQHLVKSVWSHTQTRLVCIRLYGCFTKRTNRHTLTITFRLKIFCALKTTKLFE